MNRVEAIPLTNQATQDGGDTFVSSKIKRGYTVQQDIQKQYVSVLGCSYLRSCNHFVCVVDVVNPGSVMCLLL